MLLAKLCDTLGTDIDGLHDSLSLIPEISIKATEQNNKCFTKYELVKDDITFRLNIWQEEGNSYAKLSAHTEEEYFLQNYLQREEAENEFLKLVAKPIVKVKSARN
jgi:hypothetical protein